MDQLRDEVFEVASNARRRRVLYDLLDESPQTDLPSGIDEPTGPGPGARSDLVEQYHVHLPKLDEAGFVEWSPEIHCVERGPRFAEIRPLLELLAEQYDVCAESD